MRRYEQLSLVLGDLIATHHTNYNGDGKPGFGITRQCRVPTTRNLEYTPISTYNPKSVALIVLAETPVKKAKTCPLDANLIKVAALL
ncbi:MAG: hypothetical protein HC789_10745 [Microcoleus sp. CSU_2_2]|nr:hypothetical protein [Microcoleus sp. CSU_2_2]